MKQKACFLDRDGTINYDPGYLGDPEKVKLLDGVAEGISLLKNSFNFKIIVVSNQSGISRGLISEDQVNAVNKKINRLLAAENAAIDDFYLCAYHPDFSEPKLTGCRKPSPEMILKAAEDHGIDLSGSYMAGDKATDVLCGKNAGVKTILIAGEETKKELKLLKIDNIYPNFVAANFSAACKFIIDDLSGDLIDK